MRCDDNDLLLTLVNATQCGLILLNSTRRIVFVNRWCERHMVTDGKSWDGRFLSEAFPDAELKRISWAVEEALVYGMTSMLSPSINGSPLPLFVNPEKAGSPRLAQAVWVKPISVGSASYCMIQISDESSAARRESTLRAQAEQRQILAGKSQASEIQLRAILDNIADALVTVDSNDRIVEYNPAAEALFGYPRAAIIGKPVCRLLSLDKYHEFVATASDEVHELMVGTVERREVPIELTIGQTQLPTGVHKILIFRDLTARKQIEAQIYREREFAHVTLMSISEAVLTTNQAGHVTSINTAAARLLNVSAEVAEGRRLLDLLTFVEVSDGKLAEDALATVLSPGNEQDYLLDAVLDIGGSKQVDVEARIAPLHDESDNIIGTVTAVRDVTQARRLQRRLSYQATHDELTGLINRRELQRRLDELVWRSISDDAVSSLLFLDLDQFKIVNDTCGHEAGDRLLVQLTEHLGLGLRRNDTLARLGGDEFSVLLPGCGTDVAKRIADDLRETVNEFRFGWNDLTFAIGVSVGMVVLDGTWATVAEVMSAADAACNIAKELGRDKVVVYEPDGSMEVKHHGDMLWSSRIREALEEDRFVLYCQPVAPVSDASAKDLYCEVLVRMIDQAGKLVPPMAFIPAAERYGMMTDVDRWVIRRVALLWVEQPELFNHVGKIAINLSGQSLAKTEFWTYMEDQIIAAGIPWERLCFEITETALVSNLGKAREQLKKLVARGCSFALDDFGSGLSSFTYLKNLPVSYLKIDGIFVKDMLVDPLDAALVRSISDIGRTMNLLTIAEYVESPAVFAALEEAGVDYGQGYGISVPFPIQELAVFRIENLRFLTPPALDRKIAT